MKIFTYVVILIVAAAIVAGFFVVGSPQRGRLQQFDSKRINDLTQIQDTVLSYWQNKGQVPQSLNDLTNQFTGTPLPKDPQTGTDYVYQMKSTSEFELCATFSLTSQQNQNPSYPYPTMYGQYNWDHPSGYFCFDRKIDQSLYPVIKK
jgi:hypothetical protein